MAEKNWEETHVIYKTLWYPLYFFPEHNKFHLHGPLVRGALNHIANGDALSLKDAQEKALVILANKFP